MNKVGEGWQYSVYDTGNGRVLKRFHSWPKAFWVIFKNIFPFRKDSPWEIPKFINRMREKALESFRVLERRNIPREWVGNPKFLSGVDFEQDKVRPLHEVLKNVDVKEGRVIVDKFIEFNKKLIDLGVIDKSFNITKNYGLSRGDRVVLTDLGELFDDLVLIERKRKEKIWLRYYVIENIKNKEVREYFINEMNKNFGL